MALLQKLFALGMAYGLALGCTSQPTASPCTPGQSVACTCTNGLSGAQTCTASGTYNACVCDGTDGGSANDVVGIDWDCLTCGFDTTVATDMGTGMDAVGDHGMDAARGVDASMDVPVDRWIQDIGTGLVCASPACDVTAIGSGGSTRCALVAMGQVWCWGYAPIGDGTTMASTHPVMLPGATGVQGISVGPSRACILEHSTGQPRCWGDNTAGALGTTASGMLVLAPTAVDGLTDATEVAVGANHICALRAGGGVACWGDDTRGACGDGNVTGTLTHPTTIAGLGDAIAVWSGVGMACARESTGGYVCWGANTNGQLGDGTATDQPSPVPVMGVTTAQELALGAGFGCARMPDGTVRCWGDNSQGQLGVGAPDLALHLGAIEVPGLNGVVQLVAGGADVCARLSTGDVLCWGANDQGQIGDGSTTDRPSPTPVAGLTDAVLIHLATPGEGSPTSHPTSACAVRRAGGVVCWGSNSTGALGDGSNTVRLSPVSVVGLPTG